MKTLPLFQFTKKFHAHLRARRARMAADFMKPSPDMSLLDMGGAPGLGGEWDQLRSLFGRVVLVNLKPNNAVRIASNTRVEIANACALPHPDRSFDWVFSNAVLEHVGDAMQQANFSAEMRRVARVGYFLSTPNRSFFLDPHTYLPFYHVMPKHIQQQYVRIAPGIMREWREIRMVSARELRGWFPSAKIESVGPFGMHLVAYARC